MDRTVISERTRMAARHAAHLMRLALEPWESPSWRESIFDDARASLAHAMAADVTGVDPAEAKLLRLYSLSELTLRQIDRGRAFASALILAYRKVDLTYIELLTLAETLCGERKPVAA